MYRTPTVTSCANGLARCDRRRAASGRWPAGLRAARSLKISSSDAPSNTGVATCMPA